MARHFSFTGPGVLLALLFLAGCGVGGGGGPEGIPVHGGDRVTPKEFKEAASAGARESREDPGFQNQWGLTHIRADEAYGNLSALLGPDAEPGAGVTIGIMHAGIDLLHPAFDGKNVTETFLEGAVDETGEESISFGTGVASAAAGVKTGEEDIPHGVAWGADIAMFAIPTITVTGVPPDPLTRLASADARHAAQYEQVFFLAGRRP